MVSKQTEALKLGLERSSDEQPAQQPAAFVTYKEVTDAMNALYRGDSKQMRIAKEMENKRLYTSHPASKPLTDEQVTDGCRTLGVGAYRTLAAAFEAGVRFAEAAHGIKENT